MMAGQPTNKLWPVTIKWSKLLSRAFSFGPNQTRESLQSRIAMSPLKAAGS